MTMMMVMRRRRKENTEESDWESLRMFLYSCVFYNNMQYLILTYIDLIPHPIPCKTMVSFSYNFPLYTLDFLQLKQSLFDALSELKQTHSPFRKQTTGIIQSSIESPKLGPPLTRKDMDQNVSKQKNPAKPTNSPAKKVPLFGFYTIILHPKGVNNSHIFPILAPWSALACWLLPVMASSPRRQRSPVGRFLDQRNPGNRRVSSCWLLREGGRFCVVEVVCEKHPCINLIHLFGAQKKKVAGASQILWSVIAHNLQDYPAPRCCVAALRHEKGEQLHIPFPPLHKFIEITGL